MALDDFWQVKDNQVYNGKPILNVYHVKRILAGANASIIANAFLDWVVKDDLDQLQSDGLSRTTVEVENLGDATDFIAVNSSSLPGLLPADPMPSFNAATIQFNRTRNDMKNGSKRFLVFTENENQAGDWAVGAITLLDALAAVILQPWQEAISPGVEVVEFVIMKRFCIVPAQDPCLGYRLANTDAEADDWHFVPVSATTRTRVRSQVSRKVLL